MHLVYMCKHKCKNILGLRKCLGGCLGGSGREKKAAEEAEVGGNIAGSQGCISWVTIGFPNFYFTILPNAELAKVDANAFGLLV